MLGSVPTYPLPVLCIFVHIFRCSLLWLYPWRSHLPSCTRLWTCLQAFPQLCWSVLPIPVFRLHVLAWRLFSPGHWLRLWLAILAHPQSRCRISPLDCTLPFSSLAVPWCECGVLLCCEQADVCNSAALLSVFGMNKFNALPAVLTLHLPDLQHETPLLQSTALSMGRFPAQRPQLLCWDGEVVLYYCHLVLLFSPCYSNSVNSPAGFADFQWGFASRWTRARSYKQLLVVCDHQNRYSTDDDCNSLHHWFVLSSDFAFPQVDCAHNLRNNSPMATSNPQDYPFLEVYSATSWKPDCPSQEDYSSSGGKIYPASCFTKLYWNSVRDGNSV